MPMKVIKNKIWYLRFSLGTYIEYTLNNVTLWVFSLTIVQFESKLNWKPLSQFQEFNCLIWVSKYIGGLVWIEQLLIVRTLTNLLLPMFSWFTSPAFVVVLLLVYLVNYIENQIYWALNRFILDPKRYQ